MDPLPNFDLAPLTQYPRDLLAPREEDDEVTRQAKELTLILALCFNRFKDLHWAFARVASAELQTPQLVSERNGNLFGMKASYSHLMVGTVFEMAEAVKQRARVATWRPWKEALRHMPKHARLAWQEVASLATHKSGYQPLANYLWTVRDRLSSHFDGDALMTGYKRFFTGAVSEGNEAIYVSAGHNMEATRFYFADAAAITAARDVEDSGGTSVDVASFGGQVDLALRFLIEAMLREFAKSAKKAKA
jgi:hypothetical protein